MTTTPFDPPHEEPEEPDPAGRPGWGEPVDPEESGDESQDRPDPW